MADVQRWRVPGRVNLIGEHLDHVGGLSLPFAIDRGLLVKARARDDDTLNVWSEGRMVSFEVGEQVEGWARLVACAVRALHSARGAGARGAGARGAGARGAGARGADLVIESDLPVGAGLASSAALGCGVVRALDELGALGLSPLEVARASQRAEHESTDAATGLMDQLAVLHGSLGHAVLVDSGTDPPTVRDVALDVESDGLALLVVVTGATHDHAASGYADRRRECEEAAAALGLARLAEAGPDAILRLDDTTAEGETLKARTRHVITETARVRGTLRAIEARAWTQLGTMLTASHASLRDDFAASCAELDVAVDAALEAGALGARMTGGGFGGSAIALVPRDRVAAVRELVEQRYDGVGWARPDVFEVHASDGAAKVGN